MVTPYPNSILVVRFQTLLLHFLRGLLHRLFFCEEDEWTGSCSKRLCVMLDDMVLHSCDDTFLTKFCVVGWCWPVASSHPLAHWQKALWAKVKTGTSLARCCQRQNNSAWVKLIYLPTRDYTLWYLQPLSICFAHFFPPSVCSFSDICTESPLPLQSPEEPSGTIQNQLWGTGCPRLAPHRLCLQASLPAPAWEHPTLNNQTFLYLGTCWVT